MDSPAGARLRDKSAFSAAFFLSAFGYELLSFAMTLRVYDIGGRAINVGILGGISLLARLLSPLYGPGIDRFGPRKSLALAAALIAALGLALSASARLESMYALWFLLSILFGACGNARTVMMTAVSSPSGLVGGNAVVFFFLNSARLVAPLLAGLLLGGLGPRRLMSCASPIFLACAAASLLVGDKRPVDALAAPASRLGGVFLRYREGFSAILADRRLRILVGLSAIRNGLLGFAPGLLVVVVVSKLGCSREEYGLALSAMSIGGLAGSAAGLLLGRGKRRGLAAVLGLGVHFASYGAIGLVGSYGAALALLVAGGLSLNLAAVVIHSLRDAVAEPGIRGRVYAANTAIQTIPNLVSTLASGALADRTEVGTVYVVASAAAMIILAIAAPRLREAESGSRAGRSAPAPDSP